MRTLVAAFALFAVLAPVPASAQSVAPAPRPPLPERAVTYGEVQNMRSLGVRIRLPDCKDKCERGPIDASVTPEEFMKADTLDFVGERLLKIPEFVYAMKNLKSLSLRNSLIRDEELLRMGEVSRLEILDLQEATILSAQMEGRREKAALLIKNITGVMKNLRHLNLGNLKIRFGDEKVIYSFAMHDFLDARVAERLLYLNISMEDYSDLYFYLFPSLETLIGGRRNGFTQAYEDAFALPALKVLEGFEYNADLVRARVRKRQQAAGGDKKT